MTFVTKLEIASVLMVIIIIAVFCLAVKWKQRQLARQARPTSLQIAPPGTAKGIIFGKDSDGQLVYSKTQDEGSIFVVGGSGTGKTSSILIPSLNSWTGTSFSVDISGDIFTNTTCPNKLAYEPGNPLSAPYNIFSLIDSLQDDDSKNEALEKLAFLIMPESPDLSANAKYFQDGGRNILAASLIAFYHAGLDFSDICKKILSCGYKSLFSDIDNSDIPVASMYISGFESNNEANIAGCKQNCDQAVKLFAINKTVANSIRRPTLGETAFTPQSIEQYNVFAIIPDNLLKVYAPLLHIIVAQCLDYFSARPATNTQNILFCLDEFASLGKLEINDALRKFRKKKVRIMLLTQSIADIEEVYGPGAYRPMLSNFRFKAILGVGEADAQEYVAKLIGQTEKHKTSITNSGSVGPVTSRTVSTEKDYIVDPSSLDRLGNDLILLFPEGYKRLKKAFYYK